MNPQRLAQATVIRARLMQRFPERYSDEDRAWLATPEVQKAIREAGPSVDAEVRLASGEALSGAEVDAVRSANAFAHAMKITDEALEKLDSKETER